MDNGWKSYDDRSMYVNARSVSTWWYYNIRVVLETLNVSVTFNLLRMFVGKVGPICFISGYLAILVSFGEWAYGPIIQLWYLQNKNILNRVVMIIIVQIFILKES